MNNACSWLAVKSKLPFFTKFTYCWFNRSEGDYLFYNVTFPCSLARTATENENASSIVKMLTFRSTSPTSASFQQSTTAVTFLDLSLKTKQKK